jgi:hypothetical protein
MLFILLKIAENDFEEASKGMARAIEGFSTVPACQAYQVEAQYFLDQCEWKKAVCQEQQAKIEAAKLLQFEFEDIINKERLKVFVLHNILS